ncbi:MAG: ATP-binding protein [Clostridiales bacterium]|jgi:predicted AAA+ superfamily ATPase|nr:ATP-binding protein [Clostridiales bacterium]
MKAYNEALSRLDSLIFYRRLNQDPVIKSFRTMCAKWSRSSPGQARKYFFEFAARLVESAELLGLEGNIFGGYLLRFFQRDENPFTLECERNTDLKYGSAYKLALRDAETLLYLLRLDLREFCADAGLCKILRDYVPARPAKQPGSLAEVGTATPLTLLEQLIAWYKKYFCGLFADYKMLKYEGIGLRGIKRADEADFDDIILYAPQKAALCRNTESFLAGAPAHNVLLAGARGTGKSTCVKALAKQYHDKGLRIIEAAKDSLPGLPALLGVLAGRAPRFIIFLDDLSYDESEKEYKLMKSLVEGSVEKLPKNVLLYATSNRRHIIQEKWSDKVNSPEDEADGEIHQSDAVNEKLSLADRFGLTITFPKPSPDEFMRIVLRLASREGVDLSAEELEAGARRWELAQGGLSGRAARQYVNNILRRV